jgi:hypothetical protein
MESTAFCIVFSSEILKLFIFSPSGASGIFCLGPAIFVSAAWILSLYATSVCDFVKLDEDNVLRDESFNPRAVGMWCYQRDTSESHYENRYTYPSWVEDNDDELIRARAFSMTANACGFIAWVIYLFAACLQFPPPVFLVAGLACFLACFFEGMKFWLLKTDFCDPSNTGCSLDTGGRLCISACVLWFVASLMTCGHAKERMDANKEARGEGAKKEVGGEDVDKEVVGEDEEEDTHTGEGEDK